VGTGRMVLGPQGIFAKVPGLGRAYRLLTTVLPLGRAQVTERNGELYVG
jgi:3-phenylpropionate/trans-cinnamate dioxygenase ferredoxin component